MSILVKVYYSSGTNDYEGRMIDGDRQVADNSPLVKSYLRRVVRVRTVILLWVPLFLSTACAAEAPVVSRPQETPAAAQAEPTSTVSGPGGAPTEPATAAALTLANTAEAVVAPIPSKEPPPVITAVPTTAPTETVVPSVTPTTAPSETPKPSPTTEPGRYCPETAPLKPVYDRFFLSANKWPQPDESVIEKHFWMRRPLPGAGRVLTNQRFPYGWDENGRLLLHNGVDMSEDLGTEVLAVADGTVVVAQSDYTAWYGWRCDWYGHLVVIELDDRWQDQPVYALYGHVLNILVEPGERVEQGQPVAEIGIGGAATNPHLHFEVRAGENEFGSTRNPMLWIDPGPTRGVIAGRLVDPEGRPWQGVPLALLSEDKSAVILSTWSYLGDPQDLMNPDEGWAENFVFSDVAPGSYIITTQIQDVTYETAVVVAGGDLSTAEIVTEALKTVAPEPEEAVEATATIAP